MTANYLDDLLYTIAKGYYSKDFPSFIDIITVYFRLFRILIRFIFHRVEQCDDRCVDKYGGEPEEYHKQSIDIVLNHEIKLQINNKVLTIHNEDIFAYSWQTKQVTKLREKNNCLISVGTNYRSTKKVKTLGE